MKNEYIIVFVTVSNKREAMKISQILLIKKIVACVNIIPEIYSKYWWKKRIESSKEVLLIIKTKKVLLNKLITEIKTVHTYSVPEIVAFSIIGGNIDYLNWIDESVNKWQY